MSAGARALIEASLQAVADRAGDPAPRIYARFFAARPEFEALFERDRTGVVRGAMLAWAVEMILDAADGGALGPNFVASERLNHEGLGVAREDFPLFFETMTATFAAILGEGWTAETAAAWAEAVRRLGPEL